jgi:hypothetical protein
LDFRSNSLLYARQQQTLPLPACKPLTELQSQPVIEFWLKTKAHRLITAFILPQQALGHALLMLMPILNWCLPSYLWKAGQPRRVLHGIAQVSQAAH